MANQISVPNEEYEYQHFGFAPTDLYEGIKEIIYEKYESTICKLEKEMKKIPTEILPEQELVEGISNLRALTHDNINKVLSKLKEHLLSNVIKIPDNLLLPEDDQQSTPCSEEEARRLKKDIQDLHVQIKSEKFLESLLKEELKDIEAVLESQNKFIKYATRKQDQWGIEKETLEFWAQNSEGFFQSFDNLQENMQEEVKDLTKETLNETYLQ